MASKLQHLIDGGSNNYDALLVLSFGGPEGMDDVLPFLDNVLEGLNVPDRAKHAIAKRYQQFDGISPINEETRKFITALKKDLLKNNIDLPVYWGNRNWHPMLKDTFKAMQDDGVKNIITFVTSTFSSYSGCRKYREDLYVANETLGSPFKVDKLRLGFNHPSFIEAVTSRAKDAIEGFGSFDEKETIIFFTAHSLPLSMAKNTKYVAQLKEASFLVASSLRAKNWELIFQSNNASYGEPWLEPDIEEAIKGLPSRGYKNLVIVPIGFVCDHMEVILDLDVEAKAIAKEKNINMVRANTVGDHPTYISMVTSLIQERLRGDSNRPSLGVLGPSHNYCPPDCCLSGRSGPTKPSLCQAEEID
ncbi:MAG: ferrochelatase [Gammaproteobacteria bacterium TMED78]|nr:MAG: ferrochelatase [Gammaproteobacteria bacterium TMED78]|tara:strand:- start:34661 stop:35743 length:1083 start_codon:yes stop_codon:yes gene_type:complete